MVGLTPKAGGPVVMALGTTVVVPSVDTGEVLILIATVEVLVLSSQAAIRAKERRAVSHTALVLVAGRPLHPTS